MRKSAFSPTPPRPESLACLLLIIAFVHGGARADDQAAPAATDYARFWLDELIGMDAEYGIATYDEKTIYTPAAVTVISAGEIAAHGWRTLADVLSSVRGFHISYDRSYDYIGVRGFGRPGDYNTRVLVLCDGHPVNDLIYGSAYVGPEFLVDMSTVKRIRVMHGPSAAVYGDGAFFAVVNLITRDGDDPGAGLVGVEAGSRGLRGATATWGGRTGLPGSLLVAGSAFDEDGDDLYWPQYDDPATNDGLFTGGDGLQSRHLYAKFRGRNLQATAGWARRLKGIPTGEWGMVFGDTDAWGRDERLALDLSGLHVLADNMAVRARLSYDDYEFTGNYPFDDDGSGPLERYTWRYIARGKWLGGDLQWCGLLGGSHRVLAGLNFRRSVAARQTGEVVNAGDMFLDLDNRLGHVGLYLQDQWLLGNGTSLYLGLRHDDYRSFGGNLSLRGALVARLDPRTVATLTYGGAFRAPNAYELYYTDGEIQKDNPGLEPELVDTWEGVCERELATGVCASVTVFDNRIERLIEQVIDDDDGQLTFVNLNDIRARGIELELDGRLLDGLNGRASACFQRAEDEAGGGVLTNSPARLVKLNLSTSRFERTLAGACEFQHVSRRPTLAGGWSPPYALVNLDLTWWTPFAGVQADLAIDNALDQRFGDPGAGHQLQDVLAREGRRLMARISRRW